MPVHPRSLWWRTVPCLLLCRYSLSQTANPLPLRETIETSYPQYPEHVFVPLVNLSPDPPAPGSRTPLQLRVDALHLLKGLNVELDEIVYAVGGGALSCTDELRKLHDAGQLRLILVDHNLYQGSLLALRRVANTWPSECDKSFSAFCVLSNSANERSVTRDGGVCGRQLSALCFLLG